MDLFINNGVWRIESADLKVEVTIVPRRSESGEPTRLLLRSEPSPMLTLTPEGDTSPLGWVWDGTTEDAHRLLDKAMVALRVQLDPARAPSETARRWRQRVIRSLFGDEASASTAAAG